MLLQGPDCSPPCIMYPGQCDTMCIQPPRPSSLPRQPQPHAGQRCCGSTTTTANPFPALAMPEKWREKCTSTAWRACLANCCNLSCWQSKASHTLSPAMEGQDPGLDFRALYSVDNSPLSRSLPCTTLSLKYRGGSPTPAQSWQCPRADGGRDSPAKSFKTQEEDTGSVWADLDQ